MKNENKKGEKKIILLVSFCVVAIFIMFKGIRFSFVNDYKNAIEKTYNKKYSFAEVKNAINEVEKDLIKREDVYIVNWGNVSELKDSPEVRIARREEELQEDIRLFNKYNSLINTEQDYKRFIWIKENLRRMYFFNSDIIGTTGLENLTKGEEEIKSVINFYSYEIDKAKNTNEIEKREKEKSKVLY